MKKSFSVFMSLLMILSIIPMSAINSSALSFGDYEYAISTSGAMKAVITRYNGTDENVVVPSYILGFEVVEILDNAFNLNDKIKTVTVQNGILSIGQFAFNNCINLEKVVLPDSIQEIGNWAFQGCKKLVSINIPS
ncbi:MAG: leucine-rich repeat domain-containing protein, partial [Oscillospiraceae bacterium]